jgi:probable phosphoglycerate mutase
MKASLQLVLIRHGETEWTERHRLHGRLDSPLSPRGLRQAHLTAHRLQAERADALYSSPQGRAMQTARILGTALGLAPEPLDGFREGDFGWLEGLPVANVDTVHPRGLFDQAARLAFQLSSEGPLRAGRRLQAAADFIATRHPAGRVVVVTHHFAISVLMACLLRGQPERFGEFGPWAACSLSEICLIDGGWEAGRLNDHAHLQEISQ